MTLTLTMSASADPMAPRTPASPGRQLQPGPSARQRLDAGRSGTASFEAALRHRCPGRFWEITDLSTNGTFLNDDDAPIGHGNVRDLRDGDRLRLGGYEIAAAHRGNTACHAAGGNPTCCVPIEPRGGGFVCLCRAARSYARGRGCVPPADARCLLDDDWDLDGTVAPVAAGCRLPAAPPAIAASEPPAGRPGRPACNRGDPDGGFLRGAGLPDASPPIRPPPWKSWVAPSAPWSAVCGKP